MQERVTEAGCETSAEEVICEFKIQGTLPGLNEYTSANRSSPYVAAKLKKRTEEMIAHYLGELFRGHFSESSGGRSREEERGVPIPFPVHIDYTWIEKNRRRDLDNIAFAKKFIQDAMVKSGILSDDGWNVITGFTDTFKVDKDHPGVVVVVRKASQKEGDREALRRGAKKRQDD